ncbi:MAG: FxsA family protein, partial [Hellea sp.]|nr:FxsA family protein [Hellea sp.]
MRYLFLFFILIPFVEIFLLIAVSHEVGLFIALSLLLFTAIVGIFFLRKQGLKTLFRAREKIYIG